MISRRTLFAFLFAALVGLALVAWRVEHHDGCDRGAEGINAQPATTIIESGTRTVVAPCSVWIPRQPPLVQIACLLELALVVMFTLFFFADRRAAAQQRATWSESSE